MTKSGIVKCLMSLALIVYLVISLSFTARMASADTFKGVHINVSDSMKRRFVTADDIDNELGGLRDNITSICRDSLNTLMLEKALMSRDNIESANCVVLNDGSLRIDVVPLIPIARVFDQGSGTNYYINRTGKRMQASTRYRVDVPVILGDFSKNISPTYTFPLINYLQQHPDLNTLTSAVAVDKNQDIILIPTIKGHVVNMGDTNDIENKFRRLTAFYKKVMPVKGWEYYDTLSLKWRGQIVANRRHRREPLPVVLEEEHIDLDDEGTMLTNSELTNTTPTDTSTPARANSNNPKQH